MQSVIRSCIVAIAGACLLGACTNVTEVAPTDFAELDDQDALHWRVRTTGGDTYAVARFDATESGLVIQELDRSSGAASGANVRELDEPVTIQWAEVESIERISHPDKLNTTAVVSISLFVGLVILAYVTLDTGGSW